jgi:serine beta-lactamase-like protein LACTB, mitochondrial
MTMNLSRRGFLAGTSGLAFVGSSAWAQTSKPGAGKAGEAGEAIIADMMQTWPIPGVSAAVYQNGAITWAGAFGYADMEWRIPSKPKTQFRIGSISKTIAAAVTARLIEKALIQLDVPISSYLFDLPQQHQATTLAQLLSHHGGVRHYIPRDDDYKAQGGPINLREYPTTASALAVFINDPLLSKPGTAYLYSSFGPVLAQAVLEAATKKPYLQLVAEEVTTPLKLASMVGDVTANIMPGRTRYYQLSAPFKESNPDIVGEVINAPLVNTAYKWSSGGIISTASDLVHFGAAHLAPGYLKADTLKLMFKPVSHTPPTESPEVGIIWRVSKDPKGRQRYHHTGSLEGCRAVLALYPESKTVIAFETNLGTTPEDPMPWLERLAEAFIS